MDYFGADGPTPLPPTVDEDEARMTEKIIAYSKEKYLKFFMLDFMEYSMRNVAQKNIRFCA